MRKGWKMNIIYQLFDRNLDKNGIKTYLECVDGNDLPTNS